MTRTVLITGAGGGIGRACINHFSSHGWRVIGVDRSDFGGNFPKDGRFIKADISQPDSVEQIFQQAKEFHPALDALVNNAAVQVAKPLVDTTVEEWDSVMASNLRSVFLFVKLAHPLLKAGNGGSIVNVSSVHAVQTSVNIAAYAASKGGLLALTRAMAIEFAPDNIRVNAICPGTIETPQALMNAQKLADLSFAGDVEAAKHELSKGQMIERRGTPDEIANVVLFLLSDQASFMTGSLVTADGGYTSS